MSPTLSFDHVPSQAFDPFAWFNLIGELGCVFWVAAYVFIIRQCFRDKSYGLPLVAICMNLSWEFLASWVFPNPVPLWHFFDRVWFFVDLVIVYQLVRYGRRLQTIPEVRDHFYTVIVVTTALSGIGLYTFYRQYYDMLGLVGAFMINLVMSVAFVFFFLARRHQGGAGLSVPAAWCKMLGTLGTSIECHSVIGLSQPWLGGLSFLTFLCVSIFLFDCLYIYVLMRARVRASTRVTATSTEERTQDSSFEPARA